MNVVVKKIKIKGGEIVRFYVPKAVYELLGEPDELVFESFDKATGKAVFVVRKDA